MSAREDAARAFSCPWCEVEAGAPCLTVAAHPETGRAMFVEVPIHAERLALIDAPTFPESSIPLDTEPGRDWATCGTCGRSFPDIYPAARCPFEADHVEPREARTPRGVVAVPTFLLVDLAGMASDGMLAETWGNLTCTEAETLAGIVEAYAPTSARDLIEAHALGDDDEDDEHYSLGQTIRAERQAARS